MEIGDYLPCPTILSEARGRPERPLNLTCVFCGVSLPRGHRRCCSNRCRWAAHDARRAKDPARILYVRGRNAARYAGRSNPWLLAAPPFSSHLPGGGIAVEITPDAGLIRPGHAYLLHGLLTAATRQDHDPQHPLWSLVPWTASRTGWGAYLWDDEWLDKLAGLRQVGRVGHTRGEVRFGLPVRLRTPPPPRRGRSRVRIVTMTPVCCRNDGITTYTAPTASTLAATLSGTLAARLGIGVPSQNICIEIIDRHTSAATVHQGPKLRAIRGWEGMVDLEVNAVARWLLEVAARGPGLGGRTAYGFGAIRLEALP